MKNIFVFAIEFLIIALSFTACEKETDESTSGKNSVVSINIESIQINENESSTKSTSVQNSNKQTISLGDGMSLISSIKQNTSSSTRTTTALADSTTFRVIVYDNSGTWVASKQLTVGRAASNNSFPVSAGTYTVICYSFNSTADLSFDGSSGNSLSGISGNTDLLYMSKQVTVADGSSDSLSVTFSHKFSRVKLVINSEIGNITTVSGVTLTPYYGTDNALNLKTGKITYGSTSTSGNSLTATLSNDITAETSYNILSLDTTTSACELNVATLTVNGATKNNVSENYTIKSGKSYTITWTITGLSVYETTWAPGNLVYDQTTGVYSFTSTVDGYGNYWFPDYLRPKKEGSTDWHYQSPTDSVNGGNGDPCSLVVPLNTWRLPTLAEIESPRDNTEDNVTGLRYQATHYDSSDTITNPGMFFGIATDPGSERNNYLFFSYAGVYYSNNTNTPLDSYGMYLSYDSTNGYYQAMFGTLITNIIYEQAPTGNAMSIRCVRNE